MNYSIRPGDHECFDFHRDYVRKVPDGEILETLQQQLLSARDFIAAIPADQLEVIHPPYGWSIGTVIEHCCDGERVFGYRALRFAAGDQTELPGWDENLFADSNYARPVSASDMADEFYHLRSANLGLLNRLKPAAFDRVGVADGRKMSVRTIAWLMAGHWNHHQEILELRLGMSV